jgi:hypothetical protein
VPCERLEGGLLSSAEFVEFANNVVLFVHNSSTSPRQEPLDDEKYPRLLRDKGFGFFPTLAFMDAEGNVLSQHPKQTAEGLGEGLAQAKRVAELRAKGDKATPDEQKELLLIEVKGGMAKRDGLQARADKLALTAEEKALVADKIVEMEVDEIMRANRQTPEKGGQALAAMLVAGKTPAAQSPAWAALLQHASTTKDADLAQRAYDVLMQRKDAPARAKERWQTLLDEAKAK